MSISRSRFRLSLTVLAPALLVFLALGGSLASAMPPEGGDNAPTHEHELIAIESQAQDLLHKQIERQRRHEAEVARLTGKLRDTKGSRDHALQNIGIFEEAARKLRQESDEKQRELDYLEGQLRSVVRSEEPVVTSPQTDCKTRGQSAASQDGKVKRRVSFGSAMTFTEVNDEDAQRRQELITELEKAISKVKRNAQKAEIEYEQKRVDISNYDASIAQIDTTITSIRNAFDQSRTHYQCELQKLTARRQRLSAELRSQTESVQQDRTVADTGRVNSSSSIDQAVLPGEGQTMVDMPIVSGGEQVIATVDTSSVTSVGAPTVSPKALSPLPKATSDNVDSITPTATGQALCPFSTPDANYSNQGLEGLQRVRKELDTLASEVTQQLLALANDSRVAASAAQIASLDAARQASEARIVVDAAMRAVAAQLSAIQEIAAGVSAQTTQSLAVSTMPIAVASQKPALLETWSLKPAYPISGEIPVASPNKQQKSNLTIKGKRSVKHKPTVHRAKRKTKKRKASTRIGHKTVSRRKASQK